MALITFVEIVLGLVLIALLLIPLQNVAQNVIIPFAENNTLTGNATNAINFVNGVWFALPFVVAFGVFYYGIARSQKRTDE